MRHPPFTSYHRLPGKVKKVSEWLIRGSYIATVAAQLAEEIGGEPSRIVPHAQGEFFFVCNQGITCEPDWRMIQRNAIEIYKREVLDLQRERRRGRRRGGRAA